MMKDKKKIQQPFRNPNEYSCYLEGVKAAAGALGYKVDSLTWGAGALKSTSVSYLKGMDRWDLSRILARNLIYRN